MLSSFCDRWNWLHRIIWNDPYIDSSLNWIRLGPCAYALSSHTIVSTEGPVKVLQTIKMICLWSCRPSTLTIAFSYPVQSPFILSHLHLAVPDQCLSSCHHCLSLPQGLIPSTSVSKICLVCLLCIANMVANSSIRRKWGVFTYIFLIT